MAQSHTLHGGMDVHQDASAVASVAQDHGAEVPYLGTIGTRPADIALRIRQRPSTATPPVFVYAAGSCGYWRSRSLRKNGDACWGVAPALIPQKAGDRVNTARRDAVPLARWMRAGDLTPVDVPTVEDDALRALPRAREATMGDLQAAQCRRKAFLLRHDIR